MGQTVTIVDVITTDEAVPALERRRFLKKWQLNMIDPERPSKSSILVVLAEPVDPRTDLNFRFSSRVLPQEQSPYRIATDTVLSECYYPPTGHDVVGKDGKTLIVYYNGSEDAESDTLHRDVVSHAMWRLLDRVAERCAEAEATFRIDPHTRWIVRR